MMYKTYILIILLKLIYISRSYEIESKSNLRKLSISVGGSSYYDKSIPLLNSITSNIYSPAKLPNLYFYPRSTEIKEKTLEDLVEVNEVKIREFNNSFENALITLKHKLRLIIANKIIKNNPTLYPFELEFKNISSCSCKIDFNKIEKKEGSSEPGYLSNFTFPDLPPDCNWSESTVDIIYKIMNISNIDLIGDISNDTNININDKNENIYDEKYEMNNKSNEITEINIKKNNSDFNNELNNNDILYNKKDLDENNFLLDDILNENKSNIENKYIDIGNNSFQEILEDKNNNVSYNKILDNEYDINDKKEDIEKVIEKEGENDLLNNTYVDNNNVHVNNGINDLNNVSNNTLSNNNNNNTDDNSIDNNKDINEINDIKFTDNIIIQSLDHLVQCVYKVPLDFTPWRKNNNTNQNIENNLRNVSYWLNYTSVNSEVWNNFDFKNTLNDTKTRTRFSIEGFWDLIRLIPFRILNKLKIDDEDTYVMCLNFKDEEEIKLLDDYFLSLNTSNNIPRFSSLNILPYNITYCSRPTGAQLDMIGICPSNGLNSIYDNELKSCVSITYADSVANCPQNYVHSRLWGSRRGGGACHVKERKYLPTIPKCDPPFIYNEPRRVCVIETFSPGFPGCVEGSIYYDLQTCIMAYQVMKEYNCPEGYNAIFEEDYFDRYISNVENRIEYLDESKKNFENYINSNNKPMTRIIDDNEEGPQSKYITKKFMNNKNKVKCIKRSVEEIKYNGFGAPYCQNNTYTIKYNYTNSWMFENNPKPYCEYQDIKYVDYKCPKGTVSYDVYISSGNDPPIIFRPEFNNPFDTCIEVKVAPIQPKCMTTDELPFIKIREPNNPFEKTGIHIVSSEDIKNIDKDSLINPSEIIDNSIPYFQDFENKRSSYTILQESEDKKQEFLEMPFYGNRKNNSLTEFISLNQEFFNNNDTNKEIFNNTRRKLVETLDPELSKNDKMNMPLPAGPIRLFDAILGRTKYVVEIICLKIVTAKPYLSCPENTVLVSTNTCKMKGYADFNIKCPDGYKLDEEALFLMPQEYFRKAPPRCVSKQKVFTNYYCPPSFPNNIFRPFIINNTYYNSLMDNNNNNNTILDESNNTIFNELNNTTSNELNNTIFNELNNTVFKSKNINYNDLNNETFVELNKKTDNELNNTIFHELNNKIYNESIITILKKINNTIFNELNYTVFNELNYTIFNESITLIFNKLNDTILNELNNTILNKLSNSIFNELNDIIFDESDNKVFNSSNKFYNETNYLKNLNDTSDLELNNITMQNLNDTFNEGNSEIFNKTFIPQFNINNIRVISEKSYGRTIVPSYSQKMCHEVDLIKPIWVMPLLLRKLLSNINVN